MKKIISILLSLALLLSCVAALAETVAKETLGTLSVNGEFTIEAPIPEGYRMKIKRADETRSNVGIHLHLLGTPRTIPLEHRSVACSEIARTPVGSAPKAFNGTIPDLISAMRRERGCSHAQLDQGNLCIFHFVLVFLERVPQGKLHPPLASHNFVY